MIVRSYLTGVGVTTGLTLIAWLLILFYFDPNTAGGIGLVLFFVSLTCALSGLLTLLGYVVRRYFIQDRLMVFNVALRQGVLLGLIVVGLLLLKALWVLSWWNAAMLVLAAIILEIYFRVK